MGRKTKSAVLALSVLLVVFGGQAVRASNAPERPDSPKATLQQASVTVPGPEKALVVQAALSSNTRGWTHGSGAAPGADQGIRPELVDAYTLAVALAPTECHLSLSLLAAIGQVESGNLAGQRIDAQHRVVPGVLGPVLDGSEYAAIPDTDNGRWDGHRTWDRALGPLQLLPESWRVAGMDADGDGHRDPQNVYDAAGAAMVYLCDGGRDLGTRKGLEEAVLAYNHSRDYLRLVLAWKTVFDTADVTGLGSTPPFGAWAAQTIVCSPDVQGSRWIHLRCPGGRTGQLPGNGDRCCRRAATEADAHERPPRRPGLRQPRPTRPGVPRWCRRPASPRPRLRSRTPKPDKPGDKPGKPGDKPDKPGDKPSDTALPTCPTDEPTPTDDPTAAPTCCPAEPVDTTATPTPNPSADPSADPSELRPVRHRDGCADGGSDSLATAWFRDGLVPRPPQPPGACCPCRVVNGVWPRRLETTPRECYDAGTGSWSNWARFMANTNRRPGYSVSDQSMSVEGQ